jgi:hypothetical protein
MVCLAVELPNVTETPSLSGLAAAPKQHASDTGENTTSGTANKSQDVDAAALDSALHASPTKSAKGKLRRLPSPRGSSSSKCCCCFYYPLTSSFRHRVTI